MISPNYFDYAAATPLEPKVLAAMTPYFTDKFHNPSAQYLAAKTVADDIKQARSSVAKTLGVRPSEVIFVAGGTEANNLAIQGVMSQFKDAEMLTSAVEHESVLVPAGNYNSKQIKVSSDGTVDIDDIKKQITAKTILISVIYANNEIGTIQPLKKVAKVIEEEKSSRIKNGNKLPIFFHTDASQAGNYLNLNLNSLGVDMMTINGGKIYGPKQSGVLIARGVNIAPIIVGGGQERNFRSGTENVAGIIGFTKALELAQENRKDEDKRMSDLRRLFEKELLKLLPNVKINGGKLRLSNNMSVTIPGIDNERIMMLMDENGIQVAVGSACSASSDEPSHVLTAIGLSDGQARATLRFSMGKFTTEDSVKNAIKTLKLTYSS